MVAHVGVALHVALESQHALLYVALSVKVAVTAAVGVLWHVASLVSCGLGAWSLPQSVALLPASLEPHIVASFSQHLLSQSLLEVHETALWPVFALYTPAPLRRLLLQVTAAHVAVEALQQFVIFAAAVAPAATVSLVKSKLLPDPHMDESAILADIQVATVGGPQHAL